MKIFKTIHQFLPLHAAGSEIYTYHLCRELARSHEVHLLYPEFLPGRAPYSTRRHVYHGIPCTEVARDDRHTDFTKTYLNPGMDRVFQTVFEEFQPDIFHIEHLFHLSMNFISLAKARGVPVVMTLHEYGTQCAASGLRMRPDFGLCETIDPGLCAQCVLTSPYVSRGGKPIGAVKKVLRHAARQGRRIAERFTSRLGNKLPQDPALREVLHRDAVMRDALAHVDHFIAPSRYLRDSFVKWGIPEEKITYLDYGFPIPEVRKKNRAEPAPVRFAFMGTLMPHKGADLLVEAFRRLEPGRALLKIYGDLNVHPAFSKALQNRGRHQGISFEGFLPPEKVSEAYQDIDALVVPSRWFENSPLTIHEALLQGVPVLTADLGGMKELIRDGVNGHLFEPGSVESLSAVLRKFLEHPDAFEPEALRSSLPFQDFETHARNIEKIYEKVLSTVYEQA